MQRQSISVEAPKQGAARTREEINAVIAAAIGGHVKPGRLYETRVEHEESCPATRGGLCTCESLDVDLVEIPG
jgi:hypothetical protein